MGILVPRGARGASRPPSAQASRPGGLASCYCASQKQEEFGSTKGTRLGDAHALVMHTSLCSAHVGL